MNAISIATNHEWIEYIFRTKHSCERNQFDLTTD